MSSRSPTVSAPSVVFDVVTFIKHVGPPFAYAVVAAQEVGRTLVRLPARFLLAVFRAVLKCPLSSVQFSPLSSGHKHRFLFESWASLCSNFSSLFRKTRRVASGCLLKIHLLAAVIDCFASSRGFFAPLCTKPPPPTFFFSSHGSSNVFRTVFSDFFLLRFSVDPRLEGSPTLLAMELGPLSKKDGHA